ncbi:MAG: hypothetical protein DRJ32_00330 [Thermoprotei archaeon]|nr:MAG: hypothetical protein B6U94_01010 [Thermofilum sp. ex4484_79]RLE61756.1 MAG: hypothetical protein DRJ32_00330 [Thermoprotei archaeon]HDD63692.1 hypothetical protein [Thermoprotei archaeon]
MDEKDLEIIKMKKLLSLQRKLLAKSRKEEHRIDYEEIFLRHLDSKAKKIYEKAKQQYPEVARKVALAISKLILERKLGGILDSVTLYGIFYELGYPIRLETRIVYKSKGRVKSISELIKEA